MLRFRKIACSIVFLVCATLALSQTAQNPAEPVSAALRARDFDKAIELSRSALKQFPNNAQLWTLQGIAFTSKGTAKTPSPRFNKR